MPQNFTTNAPTKHFYWIWFHILLLLLLFIAIVFYTLFLIVRHLNCRMLKEFCFVDRGKWRRKNKKSLLECVTNNVHEKTKIIMEKTLYKHSFFFYHSNKYSITEQPLMSVCSCYDSKWNRIKCKEENGNKK